MHRFHRSRLPLLVAALAVLVVLPSLAGPVDAATKRWVAKCDDVRLRTEPRTTSKVLLSIDAGARVTAVKTVRAGKWSARCGGRLESRRWLKIVAINGKSTESLFGRNAVFAAKWLFKYVKTIENDPDPSPTPTPTPTPTPEPTTTNHVSNCSVRLRTSATIDAETTAIIDENTLVTSSGERDRRRLGGGVRHDRLRRRLARGDGGRRPERDLALRRRRGLRRERPVHAGRRRRTTARASTSRTGRATSTGSRSRARASRSRSPRRPRASATRTTSTTGTRPARWRNGLKFGAYHFARPENDPVQRGGLVRRQRGLRARHAHPDARPRADRRPRPERADQLDEGVARRASTSGSASSR